MKLNGLKWLLKKPKLKTKEIRMCACGEPTKSNLAKYCVVCSDNRRLENNRVQKRRQHEIR